MSYTYKDNTDEVLSALERAKIRGLTAIGMTAEGHAKKKITQAKAVDTGRLRNSITFAVSGESANISSYSGDHGEEGGTYSGTAPNDKEKAVEIALLIALGLLTKADGFAKELDKCTEERNPEQLLKLLSTVGKK